MTEGFIPPHGGYKDLVSYQKAAIVYDATVDFCARFLDRRDRTYDQMVQAARSGKQNIIEGSMASGTSKEMEIKLTNVARASLEELLEDYRDFLRTRRAPVWPEDSKEAQYVRRLARRATPFPGDGTHETKETHETGTVGALPVPDTADSGGVARRSHASHTSHTSHSPYDLFRPLIETRPPEIVANIVICIIHQANYLLDQQLRYLEKAFLKEGGLREAMTRTRLAERDKQRRRRS